MTKYKIVVDGDDLDEEYESLSEAKADLEASKAEAEGELAIVRIKYTSTYHGNESDGSPIVDEEEYARDTVVSLEKNDEGVWE